VQLTRVKMELAAASRKKAAAEVQLEDMRKEVEVLGTWYESQEAKDTRRLEHLLHEEKMQVGAGGATQAGGSRAGGRVDVGGAGRCQASP
jgi:hypothetical protein